MSDALNFAEIDGQHVELLPARTVMSMFTAGSTTGGAGGGARGGLGIVASVIPITVLGDQSNGAGNAVGGAGGRAG